MTAPASRRTTLPQPGPGANLSLYLTRYLPDTSKEKKDDGSSAWKAGFVRELVALNPVQQPLYAAAHARWRETLSAAGAYVFEASTLTPTLVGLGDKGALEAGLSLHFSYGVPVLPGSSLKGLVSHYADQKLEEEEWRVGGAWHRRAFGTLLGDQDTEDGEVVDLSSRGEVTFYTALAKPKALGLRPEVMTVHHPKYYMQEKPDPPADWDLPTPVPFLSTHGTYVLALACDDRDLAQAVYQILVLALRHAGIGAKTSSGFGRLRVTTDPFAARPMPAALDLALNNVRAIKGRRDIARGQLLDSRITHLLGVLRTPDAQPFAAQALQDLYAHLDALLPRKEQNKEFKDRPWRAALISEWGERP